MTRQRPHSERASLWPRRLLRLLGGLVLVWVVLVALVLVTVNLPAVRARIARETSALVSEEIAGTLSITAIGSISLGPTDGVHVSGIDAELLDTSNRRTLAVSGVQANLELSRLLASLVTDAPLTLSFEQVGIVHAEARFIEGVDGKPSLVSALQPVRSSTPRSGTQKKGAPRPFRLYFEDVTLERGSARGELGGIPDLDLELSELTGRVSVDPEEVRFELRRLAVWARDFPVLRELRGELSASMAIGIGGEDGEPLELETAGQFVGSMSGIPLRAEAHYSGRRLSGYVRVDEATPAAFERLWPEAAFDEPISSMLAVDGTFERLQVTGVLRSQGGNVYTTGNVALSPAISGRLSVFGAKLNAEWWRPDAPQSSIQMAAASSFVVEDGAVSARVALRTWSSVLAGRDLPDLRVSARLTPRALDASVRADVPGAELLAQVRMAPLHGAAAETRLELKLEAAVASLARVARELSLGDELAGEGQLEASGVVSLGAMPSLRGGRLSATFQRASAGWASVERVTLTGVAEGPLVNPRLLFSLTAEQFVVPLYPIERVSVSGRGNLQELAIDAAIQPERAPLTRVTLRVSPMEKRVADLVLVMGRGKLMVSASAERLRLTPSGFELRQLAVRGPGELKLDAALDGDRLRVAASASELNAAALLRRVGFDLELPHSLADLSLRIDYRPGHMSGQVQGAVTKICSGKLRGGALEADLELDDDVVDGTASLRLAPFGEAQLQAQALRLPPRWTARQLSRMTGQVELRASADLEELRAIVPPDWFPDFQASGRLESKVNLTREPGGSPEISLVLSSKDLAWWVPESESDAAGSSAELAARPDSLRWEGMDVELTAEVVQSRLESRATIVDPRGSVIAELRGTSRLPVEQLSSNPGAVELRELPIDLQLQVPDRKLSDLPPLLRPNALAGLFGAQFTVTGRVGRPELTARLKLDQLTREGNTRARPLSMTADARVVGERLEAVVRVSDEQRKLLSLLANARLTGGGQRPGLRGLEVELRSNGVPLEPLGGLLGYELKGELYGSLLAKDVPENPTLQGILWVNEPSLDGFRQKRARWVIRADADAYETELALEQKSGHAHASASGPWQWREQLAPTLQPDDSRVSLHAKSFDLRALRPLLPEQVRALRGLLDAELESEPGPQRDLMGTIQLREGMVHVSELGQAFKDVSVHATLGPRGSVQIQKVSARGLRGTLIVSGELDLDGLAVRSGQLTVRIPKADPLPIMLEGVTIADAWGRLNIVATGQTGAGEKLVGLNVEVSVPRFHVTLPEQSPHDVQELDADSTIVMGAHRGPEGFIPFLPVESAGEPEPRTTQVEPFPVRVEIKLGGDVWIERGTQLEVKLAGNAVAQLQGGLSIQGELRLSRGEINVQGRVFEIERGVITFLEQGIPSNPTVVATAGYTAPEGTRVYADFVGPVKTGKLSLRSEPPLREDQILSLLLFGSEEGSFGSSTGGDPASSAASSAAFAAGGGVVTRGLNQELKKLTSIDIQTRIGEREGEPQPEVAVQISPRLTAELGYTIHAPETGRSLDRTQVTLDLRLLRNWSLSTTIGDAGSVLLDLLWRYRY